MAKKSSERKEKKTGFFGFLWKGLVFLWQHPLIITIVLLILAGFLFREVIVRTFAGVMNCNYLLVTKLAWPDIVCSGYTVEWPAWFPAFVSEWLNANVHVSLPGLSGVVDPLLEISRKVIVWSAVILSALLSFFLTVVLSKLRSVARLILLNREEWRNFLFGLRTWAFLFLLVCGAFYYWANIYLMQPR